MYVTRWIQIWERETGFLQFHFSKSVDSPEVRPVTLMTNSLWIEISLPLAISKSVSFCIRYWWSGGTHPEVSYSVQYSSMSSFHRDALWSQTNCEGSCWAEEDFLSWPATQRPQAAEPGWPMCGDSTTGDRRTRHYSCWGGSFTKMLGWSQRKVSDAYSF